MSHASFNPPERTDYFRSYDNDLGHPCWYLRHCLTTMTEDEWNTVIELATGMVKPNPEESRNRIIERLLNVMFWSLMQSAPDRDRQ